MDWFSWLSKAGFEPYLVYEYGLTFSHNELEEEDIAHFNHDFLQSMGISIAKHRLEILKLATKERTLTNSRPVSRLLFAIKKTKKCLVKYFKTLVRKGDSSSSSSALLVVHPRNRWKVGMLKRNKKLKVVKHGRLLLTNGTPLLVSAPARVQSFSSPMMLDYQKQDKLMEGDEDGYRSTAFEEIRWDTMFQNLKPT